MLIDYFALAVLIILATAALVIVVLLGIMPGRIARGRNHPQADAINVCGWWGVITMGILMPVAFIWAYTKPGAEKSGITQAKSTSEDTAS